MNDLLYYTLYIIYIFAPNKNKKTNRYFKPYMTTFMNFTPQLLVEQTHNFYGLKADIAAAAEFLKLFVGATPGSFYEWVTRDQRASAL